MKIRVASLERVPIHLNNAKMSRRGGVDQLENSVDTDKTAVLIFSTYLFKYLDFNKNSLFFSLH